MTKKIIKKYICRNCFRTWTSAAQPVKCPFCGSRKIKKSGGCCGCCGC